MYKKTIFVIYSLIYLIFMVIIRYILSNAHGFLIEHCLLFFMTVAIGIGYLHGYNLKFNFNIILVAVFIMLFVGILTPPSKFFLEYKFVDFQYISTCTLLIIGSDIAGSARKSHLIQKRCFELAQEKARQEMIHKWK